MKLTNILVALGVILAGCQAATPETTNDILETYTSLSPQARALYYQQSEELTKPVPDRLVELDQKTIGCFGAQKVMQMSTDAENLGGQCCGALTDFEAYELQLEALEQFIVEHDGPGHIPTDPYDVSVELAQELTDWDTALQLTQTELKTYEEALELSHHGPCCCRCWKWYMMSGLGKKLIQEGWGAEDVAQLWDLSSSCGHDEDTDIKKHYSPGSSTHSH